MYQKRVENTPKREQDLIALKRNYTNVQRSYANLLDRTGIGYSVDMERKQKGQKFSRLIRPECLKNQFGKNN